VHAVLLRDLQRLAQRRRALLVGLHDGAAAVELHLHPLNLQSIGLSLPPGHSELLAVGVALRGGHVPLGLEPRERRRHP